MLGGERDGGMNMLRLRGAAEGGWARRGRGNPRRGGGHRRGHRGHVFNECACVCRCVWIVSLVSRVE